MALALGDVSALPIIAGYAICSSLLAIINKYAITVFPFSSLLTFLQYVTSVVTVLVLGKLKVIEHDEIKISKLKAFFPAAFVFYLAIFTNTNLLRVANVETFIVFRSSTPILVAIADTIFRSQPIPSSYSFGALSLILLGAVGYVLSDSQFSVTAYFWAVAYLITIVSEMVYVKHTVSNVGLGTWGLVLYTNFISLLVSPIFWIVSGEYKGSMDVTQNHLLLPGVFLPVALSCAFGVAISFFGYACRQAISATAFSVVGVTNKLLTVIINVLIWDKHASPTGLTSLLLTILGGVLYQQSVTRPAKPLAAKGVDMEAGKGGGEGSAAQEGEPLMGTALRPVTS